MVAGTRSFAEILAYCVAKSAVDQMTRCAALELSTEGVRVNSVNPGAIVTRDLRSYEIPFRIGRPDSIRKLRANSKISNRRAPATFAVVP